MTGWARRDGDVVRRPTEFWSAAVHRLLYHLEVAGFPAPRLVRVDGHEEVLSWIASKFFWTSGKDWLPSR